MKKWRIASLIVLLLGIVSFCVIEFVGEVKNTDAFSWNDVIGCFLILIWILSSALVKILVVADKRIRKPIWFTSLTIFVALFVWAIVAVLFIDPESHVAGFKYYHDIAGGFLFIGWPIFDVAVVLAQSIFLEEEKYA